MQKISYLLKQEKFGIKYFRKSKADAADDYLKKTSTDELDKQAGYSRLEHIERSVETETLETEAIEPEAAEAEALETEATETEATETEATETEALETEALETEALETEALETEALETEALETEALETEATETEALETEATETETTETEAVKSEALETEANEYDVENQALASAPNNRLKSIDNDNFKKTYEVNQLATNEAPTDEKLKTSNVFLEGHSNHKETQASVNAGATPQELTVSDKTTNSTDSHEVTLNNPPPINCLTKQQPNVGHKTTKYSGNRISKRKIGAKRKMKSDPYANSDKNAHSSLAEENIELQSQTSMSSGNNMNKETPQKSVISKKSTFVGTMRSEIDVLIEGDFEGEVYCQAEVTIADGANVSAIVKASSINIGGAADGEFYCEKRITIRSTGEMRGKAQAPVFSVEEGAFFEGEFKMGSENSKSKITDSSADISQAAASVGSPSKTSFAHTRGNQTTDDVKARSTESVNKRLLASKIAKARRKNKLE